MEFQVAARVMLKVLEKLVSVDYKLELPQELSGVHNTFHVSNLKKCYADEPLAVMLDGLYYFVEETIEIMDREAKRLKRSRIPTIKVRWNSRRGPEFTWEREDQFMKNGMNLPLVIWNGVAENFEMDGYSTMEKPVVIALERVHQPGTNIPNTKATLQVKEFVSLANMKVLFNNEGFMDLKICYMGELWVMMEFGSKNSLKLLKENVSIGSWFSQIINASLDFVPEGRIAWIEVEGVPMKLWSENSFKCIASKWGEMLDFDDQEEPCFHSKRICVLTKNHRIIPEEAKITHRGKVFWIRAKETTGWFPDFEEETDEDDQSNVNSKGGMPNERETGFADEFDGEDVPETLFEKEEPIQNQNKNTIKQESESSLNHSPGFTPKAGSVRSQVNEEEVRGSNFENVDQKHCGGSILNLVDDVVKVRRVMGYNMDGCLANIENIIESQGVDEGSILNVSDYFVMVRGVWRQNGKKVLFIAIYAPQDVKEKRVLTMEADSWAAVSGWVSGCLISELVVAATKLRKRFNQDDVLNISTSFFVTNFPEQTTTKELWRLCKQYGNVFDVFIPNRRSKLVDSQEASILKDEFSDKNSDMEEIPETVFDKSEHVGNISPACNEVRMETRVEEKSDDPFNIYDMLNKKKFIKSVEHSDSDIQYPSGFTPCDRPQVNSNMDHINETKVIDKEPGAKASFQEDVNVSGCSGHFQSVKAPKWNGEVLLMGDFNEVRLKEEMHGSIFNSHGAAAFNSFIVDSGLVEVPFGGFSFTWSHRSATKMSRLDRFLGSEDLQRSCPNLSSLTLDRYLSDHRPILLRELNVDYGPTPFRFFHNWFDLDGFDSFISDTWCNINIIEPYTMFKMAKKLKILKGHIRKVSLSILEDRLDTMNKLASLENMKSSELAQKAKVKWSIKGDENSKFFHGIINKRRNNLAIRGIMVDEDWMEDPTAVKKEFFSHFQNRFEAPCATCLFMDMKFPNILSSDQALDLERHFSKEEIKGAVWDCGLDKWFHVWLLPWILELIRRRGAKLVKDFRPISLIGSLYKIITKLLANRLVIVIGNLVNDVQSAFIANCQILDGPFILNELIHWCKAKKKETMIFKVDFEKAFDTVRWDFLEDVLKNFRFGSRWCDWIGDPLSPFLFILVMETLHLSFQNVVNTGLFKGVVLNSSLQLSYLFYADDAIFIGINLKKSKLMGVAVENSLVTSAANNIGCMTLSLLFPYLGVNVGSHMSRIASWDVVINKVLSRLSKWKMKEMRGLGVSSFYALNRALIFKWVWRFRTQGNSIWTKVIKALHGEEGNLDWPTTVKFPSNWLDIIRSFSNLYNKSVDLLGDGEFYVSSVRNYIDNKILGTVSSKTQWCKFVLIKNSPLLKNGGSGFLIFVSRPS
nr:hypothetical protein [Tanacetum cinerariifolium]